MQKSDALCPLCKRPWRECTGTALLIFGSATDTVISDTEEVTAEENKAADESMQSQRSILQEREIETSMRETT